MNVRRIWIRPWVWLKRWRHRCGYGVHSPFAFDFITHVIYEKGMYYKYEDLLEQVALYGPRKGKQWAQGESEKVRRLLFRVVNRVQPACIYDVGTPTAAALYLQAAMVGADFRRADDLEDLMLPNDEKVGLLYLHDYQRPDEVWKVFHQLAGRTDQGSVFIIEGVGYTRAMKELWQRCLADERSGIAFDLYDVGIIFFDHTRIKQDYVVNF